MIIRKPLCKDIFAEMFSYYPIIFSILSECRLILSDILESRSFAGSVSCMLCIQYMQMAAVFPAFEADA